MKRTTPLFFLLSIILLQGYSTSDQDIDFNVFFNGAPNVNVLLAKPTFTNAFYFVGLGCLGSLLFPTFVRDLPLTFIPVNDGL